MESKIIYKEFESLMKRYERRKKNRIHKEHINPFKYKRVETKHKGK